MAGADEFLSRIGELQEQVGVGDVTGTLLRDQVYAHYQEVRLDLKHPRGGQAMYQESSLYDFSDEYLQGIADEVLASGTDQAMANAMERFDNHARDRCPRELEILANSGHPTVTSNGATVYDREPIYPRLSEAELEAAHDHVNGPSTRRRRRG
jgi:hypothetical protein